MGMQSSSPEDDPTILRFASQLLPSPPNAAPPTPFNLDPESAAALYSHAVLLFHAYSWHQSIKYHRSILRRDVGGLLPAAHLWFNIAIIRCHLGEYALAVEAFDKAIEHDPELAIAWFCMGIALFQLGDYRRAERRFKQCLACLGPDVVLIDYKPQGLNFSLEKTRVEFNIRLCLLWKLHKQVKADRPPSWSLNRMPAGLLIEPDEQQASKKNCPTEAKYQQRDELRLQNSSIEATHQQEDELRLPLLTKSRSLKNAPKRVLTLLRRRPRRDIAAASTGRVLKATIRSAPSTKETTSGMEIKPLASSALYIPTRVGPHSPLPATHNSQPTDAIGRHLRNDSFAIIAPESGLFKPLPPLPLPPIGSNTPPARRSFAAARRQSALALLTGERAYSSSAPVGLEIVGGGSGGQASRPVQNRTGPSPLSEEYRGDMRDSLTIFAMGVLKKAEESEYEY